MNELLGGLAMGIGMLVDSSIVVLESIYRCREEGDSVRQAAIRGTREVRGAVTASTLTSICVFFPMVFVEGLAGQVFAGASWAFTDRLSGFGEVRYFDAGSVTLDGPGGATLEADYASFDVVVGVSLAF